MNNYIDDLCISIRNADNNIEFLMELLLACPKEDWIFINTPIYYTVEFDYSSPENWISGRSALIPYNSNKNLSNGKKVYMKYGREYFNNNENRIIPLIEYCLKKGL